MTRQGSRGVMWRWHSHQYEWRMGSWAGFWSGGLGFDAPVLGCYGVRGSDFLCYEFAQILL